MGGRSSSISIGADNNSSSGAGCSDTTNLMSRRGHFRWLLSFLGRAAAATQPSQSAAHLAGTRARALAPILGIS